MSDESLEDQAVAILRSRGFSANRIARRTSLTPDIRAKDGEGGKYLFELKDRTNDWMSGAVEVNPGVFRRSDLAGPSNKLAGVFKKAASQLDNEAADSTTLRVLWFTAQPTDQQYHYTRICETAYGAKLVIATNSQNRQGLQGLQGLYGFYVDYSSFVELRDKIDCVLLGHFVGLLLNDLSPRYEKAKGSVLAALCGFVKDPQALKRSGQCYYLPPDPNDFNPSSVKQRLEDIYGISVLTLISLNRVSAAVSDKYDQTSDST
jgi:hypothetical protein